MVKKVRSLLVEREIPQFVTDEQRGLRVEPEFAYQGVIDLGGQQVIQHVHGRGEEDSDIGLASSPAEDLGKVGLASPRIPDENHVGAFAQEVEIKEPENAALALHPGLVVLEVKGVDAGLSVEAREVEPTIDGAAVAGFQFKIGQCFESGSEAKVLGRCLLQGLFHLLAHRRQFQLFELLFQGGHEIPFLPQG